MKFFISEYKKIFRPCLIVTSLATILFIIITFNIKDDYALFYNIELWGIASQYLGLFYVLIAVVPLCWIMVYERKDDYILYVMPRISIRKYILSKFMINGITAFISIFLISFIGLITILYVFSPVEIVLPISENDVITRYYKGYYMVNNPLLYGFVLSVWRGVMAFLYATLGFVLSLFYDNIFVVLATPFLFDLVDSYMLGSIGCSWMDTMTSFDPSRVRAEVVSKYSFLFAALTIVIEIAIFLIYFKLYKKEKIVKV